MPSLKAAALVASLCALGAPARAAAQQVSVGIVAGINAGDLSGPGDPNGSGSGVPGGTRRTVGFLGAEIALRLSAYFSIGSQILYDPRGGTKGGANPGIGAPGGVAGPQPFASTKTFEGDFISLPLMARFDFPVGRIEPYLESGFSLDILVACRVVERSFDSNLAIENETDLPCNQATSPGASFVIGTGAQTRVGFGWLGLGLRLQAAFNRLGSEQVGGLHPWRTRTLSLQTSYRIPIGG